MSPAQVMSPADLGCVFSAASCSGLPILSQSSSGIIFNLADATLDKMAKRFVIINDEELASKSKKAKNENTVRTEKRADKAFTNFLMEMGVPEQNCDYWNYEEPELDTYLAKFWFGARKQDDENSQEQDSSDPELKKNMYKATTLRNMRYGLNRILKNKGHLYDITDKKTASFTKSQQAFNDAIKELKSEGKGDVSSYPEIEEEGKTCLN